MAIPSIRKTCKLYSNIKLTAADFFTLAPFEVKERKAIRSRKARIISQKP